MVSFRSWKKQAAATLAVLTVTGTAGPLLSLSHVASASSHREAPLSGSDPESDLTDVYFFRSPDNQSTVTAILSVWPFEEPAGGPNFYKFGDDVFYRMNFDNDGDAKPDVIYEFDFQTLNQNRNSALIATSPITSLTANNYVRQTYSVWRVDRNNENNRTLIAENLPAVPSYIGRKTQPNYNALFHDGIKSIGDGLKVFAGQTDDAFQVDLGGVFDLLNVPNSPHVDGLKGYNVQSIALQIPINQLTKNGNIPTDVANGDSVVGFWATTLRPRVRVLNNDGSQDHTSQKVQVSRLGHPLVNEVVIPLSHKDRFNASKPKDDAQFGQFVTDPELAKLFNAVFGLPVPPTPRNDLVKVFLTGIPGLTKPTNVKPSEQLRLNVAVPVNPNPNVLGVVAGDNQGYPNGRRLFDDVTDIALKAVAGAAYPLLKEPNDPAFTPPAAAGSLSDSVGGNDLPFLCTFPFIAKPWEGLTSIPHANATSGPNQAPQCQIAGGGSSSSVSSASSVSSMSSSSVSSASSSSVSSTSSVSSSSVSSSSVASSVAGGAPTCNGQTATIWVNANGIIVGGSQNGVQFNGYLGGTSGNDVIVGTLGNDTIFGQNGDDLICAGEGHDYVNAGDGADTVFAQGGNDTVEGGNGNDTLNGGEGHDSLDGKNGSDNADGGNGQDQCVAESKNSCEF